MLPGINGMPATPGDILKLTPAIPAVIDSSLSADKVTLGAATTTEAQQSDPRQRAIPARASTRELYFGSNRGQKITFTQKPPNNHFKKGFWVLDHVDWKGAGNQFLDLGSKPGTVCQPDREGNEPLGRLIRTRSGWLGESLTESNLPYTRITRSKLCTFIGDDGTITMTLTELFREGGGAIYRLDADAYRRNNRIMPPVLEKCVFAPGEEVANPSFPFKESPKKKELSSLEGLTGEWATHASFARRGPSEEAPSGGWQVHLKRPWQVENDLMLSDAQAQGFEQPRGPYEKQIFDRWTRVSGGWQNIDRARPTPENFDQVNEARLRTLLTDEGHVFMTLYEEYVDGTRCAFILDSGDYMADPGMPPAVLASQFYSAENPLDEKALLAMVAKKKLNIDQPKPDNESTVEEGNGWIVIDGIRMKVNEKTGDS